MNRLAAAINRSRHSFPRDAAARPTAGAGEQTKLVEMLDKYLDPDRTFWTSLENKPISRYQRNLSEERGSVAACRSHLFWTAGDRSSWSLNRGPA